MTAAADNKNYLIRLLAVVLTGILACQAWFWR